MKTLHHLAAVSLLGSIVLCAGSVIAADKTRQKKKGAPAATAPAAPAAPAQPGKQDKPDTTTGVGNRLKEIQREATADTETATSTVAEKEALPEGEPGSQIPADEAQPPRPPTAQEIEGATSKEAQLALLER